MIKGELISPSFLLSLFFSLLLISIFLPFLLIFVYKILEGLGKSTCIRSVCWVEIYVMYLTQAMHTTKCCSARSLLILLLRQLHSRMTCTNTDERSPHTNSSWSEATAAQLQPAIYHSRTGPMCSQVIMDMQGSTVLKLKDSMSHTL